LSPTGRPDTFVRVFLVRYACLVRRHIDDPREALLRDSFAGHAGIVDGDSVYGLWNVFGNVTATEGNGTAPGLTLNAEPLTWGGLLSSMSVDFFSQNSKPLHIFVEGLPVLDIRVCHCTYFSGAFLHWASGFATAHYCRGPSCIGHLGLPLHIFVEDLPALDIWVCRLGLN